MLQIVRDVEKEIWDIERLQPWGDNPRRARPDGLERLKTSLTKFQLFKPLKVLEDGTVIGGNMRLHVLKEMGVKQVWVMVVRPKDRADMLEISLADNDSIGYYDQNAVAELLDSVGGLSPGFENIRINATPPALLQSFMDGASEELGKEATKDTGGAKEAKQTFDTTDQRQIVVYVRSDEKQEIESMFDTLQRELGLKNRAEVLLALLDKFKRDNV